MQQCLYIAQRTKSMFWGNGLTPWVGVRGRRKLSSEMLLTCLKSNLQAPFMCGPNLQVVPSIFFVLLDKMVALRQAYTLDLPQRLEKTQLRELAHLPQRAELASLSQIMAAYAANLQAFDR